MRIGVFTSGGDAPGMNAAIRAVVRGAQETGDEIIGIRRGYAGMIKSEFIHLGPRDVANTIQRGGTILQTARSQKFMTPEGRAEAAERLHRANIEGLVAIGGDGTFAGAIKLFDEQAIPTVGVPGTIDNDLFGTDDTIGYDTAMNTALDAIDRIRDTAAAHDRVFFIEVMGRHAGFLGLEVGLAGGAEIIALPEVPVTPAEIVKTIEDSVARGKMSSIIVVAEGAYPGGAQALFEATKQLTGYDARVSILGHIQRGGAPSARDRVLASRLGAAAVQALSKGTRGVMAGVVENEVIFTPLADTIAKKKPINMEIFQLARTLAR